MKGKPADLAALRHRLLQQMPDPATILPGSLLRRMVRCNKPGCQKCEKGKGHGPIWILSVSLANRKVRQIPIPDDWKPEVDKGLHAFAQSQKLLKQIGLINLDGLKQRKQER
jgi:Family of unknown function (DUF6788)